MKIDLSTVKPDKRPYIPPYSPSEVNLQLVEEQKIYLPYGMEYAAKHNVSVVANLKQALESRAAGKFVITLREADVAARSEIPLSNELIRSSMLIENGSGLLGVIHEGIPGLERNIFDLRNQYNKGVNFYKTGKYQQASVVQQQAANLRMKDLRAGMEKALLPLWPEEIENGVATELCKPEYMTWHQYQEASTKKLFLFDLNPSHEFESVG